MGRGHPTSRPTSYVTGLEVLLEAKNAEVAKLQAQVDEQNAFATKCVNKISRFRAALNHISRHFGSAEQCREIAQAAIKGECNE